MNCCWTALDRLPHACSCSGSNSDATLLMGPRAAREPEWRGGQPHAPRFLLYQTHHLGTARTRDGELPNTISEAQHPRASKFLQSTIRSCINEATATTFTGDYPLLERDWQKPNNIFKTYPYTSLFTWTEVEISVVPFQAIFGRRLYLSTDSTEGEKKANLKSRVTVKIVQ